MSDPQINIEIEDVLASIRRLVSEGEAPRAPAKVVSAAPAKESAAQESVERDVEDAPMSAPVVTANSSAAPDKLVLSPDQMIAMPTAKESVTEADAPFLLTPDVMPVQSDTSVDGDAEVALDAQAEPEEPAGTAPKAPEVDAPVATESLAEEMWHSVRSAPVAETPDDTESGGRKALLSTIAELEAAVSDTSDEFEPDGSEQTPVVDWAETTANGAIFGARAATTRIADIVATVPDSSETETLEAKPISEAVQPSESKGIFAEAIIEDGAEAIVSRLDDDLVKYLEAETTVDEETLRDMVREIVRQELQGALGERITRNVRKLVRREIYRVLNSEEFN